MRFASFAIVMAVLSCAGFAGAAQDVRAPLPGAVLQAKTVYVENRSGFVRARDEFADEMGKWNRMRIVYSKASADLVVVLTAQRTAGAGTTRMALLNATTGREVWADSKPWSDGGAVRDLVSDLKQGIGEQERR